MIEKVVIAIIGIIFFIAGIGMSDAIYLLAH